MPYMRPRVVIASFDGETELCDCIGLFARAFPDAGPYFALCRDSDRKSRCLSCAAEALEPETCARIMPVLPADAAAFLALPRGRLSENTAACYVGWLGNEASERFSRASSTKADASSSWPWPMRSSRPAPSAC